MKMKCIPLLFGIKDSYFCSWKLLDLSYWYILWEHILAVLIWICIDLREVTPTRVDLRLILNVPDQ